MNRRHFCKVASLMAASVGLSRLDAAAQSIKPIDGRFPVKPSVACTRIGRGCRLSIIRRECHTDLQAIFLDDPDTGPCELFESGQEFQFSMGQSRPEGFCPRLWESLCSAVADMSPSCATPIKDGTLVIACPDGTRPVIARIDIN